MALELIGALIAAAALGLLAWAIRRKVSRLPKWFVPVAAGLGLIGTTVWLEYDWFGRVSAELPPGFEVVNDKATSNPLRPWTYVAPITTSFAALERPKLARHPVRADLVIAPVYTFARWQPVRNLLMVFDCTAGKQAPVGEGTVIDEAGSLTGGEWVSPAADDELQEAACREG